MIGTVNKAGQVELDPAFQRWLALFRDQYNVAINGGVPAGSIMPTFGTENVGSTWLLLNGQVVNKRDFPALYAVLSGHVTETTDTFTLPNMTNRTVMGAGAVALMAQAGASQVTLTVGQLPSHGHTITDPGHSHGFTGAPHSHTITDPGHTHTAAALGTLDALTMGAGTSTAASGNTGSATTGITVDAATAGGTVASGTTGITVANTGSGDPVDITPPVMGVNWLIKT